MAFTVEDFHDLIELLAQRPEWRAELRRHVLSDELLELPALVRQLVEAQARAESRLERVESRLDRVEARLERVESRLEGVESRLDRLEATVQALADAQARAEARLERLEDGLIRLEATVQTLALAQSGIETVVGRLQDRVGDLDGRVLEAEFARRGPAYLSSVARRLQVIEPGALANLLDDAVDDDQLTDAERDTILLTDVVLSGRRRDGGDDIYLLVGVSGRIDLYDVQRAAERASLLEKLGKPVIPAVAGRRIDADVAEAALDQGVWYVLGGRVTAPRSA